MSRIENFAECVLKEFVNDGRVAKAKKFIGNSQITIYVPFGILCPHSRRFPNPMADKAALQTKDIVAT